MATTALEIILRARDDASKVVSQAGKSMTSSLQQAEKASLAVAKGLAVAGVAAVGLGAVGVRYAGQLESLQIALETVTGSSEDAARAMDTIKRVAAESPFFETQTLASFVQLMAASGQEIDEAVESALGFGDVAAAFGKGNAEMTRMGNTLSQVIGKGKADVIDLRELVNAGWVSVRTDVAETMGVTMAQFEDMVSAGEVGYEDIRRAAEKFTGSAQKQSQTFSALMQRMGESFQTFVADLVVDTGIFDGVKAAMNGLIEFVDTHGESMKGFIRFLIENWPLVAGAITGALIPAMIAWAKVFWTTTLPAITASVVAMAPFIAAGLVIGGLALIIMKNWEPIKAFFTSLWGGITSTVSSAMNFVGQKIAWFRNNWAEAIGMVIGFFATLPIKLPLYVVQAIGIIINYLRTINWGAVFDSIVWAARNAWNNVWNAAVSVFNRLRGLDWGAILTGIGRGIGNAVIGMIEGAINGALSGIPGIGSISLPRFANGTDFAPGGLAIVGERGPELVNLPRGSQVIPNHQLDGSGGVSIGTLNITNNQPFDWTAQLREMAFELR